eukprot:SAG31_NODE_8274_length_1482_cov_1.261027_3_plen_47_part_01
MYSTKQNVYDETFDDHQTPSSRQVVAQPRHFRRSALQPQLSVQFGGS